MHYLIGSLRGEMRQPLHVRHRRSKTLRVTSCGAFNPRGSGMDVGSRTLTNGTAWCTRASADLFQQSDFAFSKFDIHSVAPIANVPHHWQSLCTASIHVELHNPHGDLVDGLAEV